MYCGMHTVTDCVGGAVVGSFAWLLNAWYGEWLENVLVHGGLEGKFPSSLDYSALTVMAFY